MANTIKIKRGLSSNISSLSLAEGELAVTTDTNELYVNNTTEPINKIRIIKLNGTEQTPSSGVVNLTVPTTLSDFGVTATATELNYVDGVTSSIQTQLNNKAASSHTHAASAITSGTLSIDRGGTGASTAATALSNLGLTATATELNTMDGITATTTELNTLDGITATTTELNYTDGVTSNIQTQLDNKLSLSGGTLTGQLSITSNGQTVTLGSGNSGWCHYTTTAPSHWFNTKVAVCGTILKGSSYNVNVPGVFIQSSTPSAVQTGDIWFS